MRPGYFNPRPPRGGRPARSMRAERRVTFQSTPSPRRATDRAGGPAGHHAISIHALPAEGDPSGRPCAAPLSQISIHALPAEGDREGADVALEPLRISIHALPAEGDGRRPRISSGPPRHFNPRPPRGGRREVILRLVYDGVISIHALPAEGDPTASTPPSQVVRISIHALPAEGDQIATVTPSTTDAISIHALPAEGDSSSRRV